MSADAKAASAAREGLTAHEALAIHAVLVEHCGERADEVGPFVYHQTRGLCVEYRFCGSLGFGGKFWRNNGWYVNCYGEDLTPERDAAIKAANAALAPLYEAHANGAPGATS